MPRGIHLTDETKEKIYTSYTMGERVADLSDMYGLSEVTIRRAISNRRKYHEEMGNMATHSKIVSGDKRNGRLTSTPDPHRFEGTCVVAGKAKSKTFTAKSAREATEQWEKWCQTLRDEQAFMNMVERKFDAIVEDAEPESANVVCGYPGDPIEEIRPIQAIEPAPTPDIDVRPWRDVAEERQRRIEELEARVKTLEEGSSVAGKKPVYVVWAKSKDPRMFGAFMSMEQALRTLDELNEVAAFLGSEDAFEVEEVQWK